MNEATAEHTLSKVPQVTFLFWLLKIAATTLGEPGGDAVSMSMHLGYLVGTAIFAVLFIAAVYFQIVAKKFHPFVYWATIIASTTVGTAGSISGGQQDALELQYVGGGVFMPVGYVLANVAFVIR